MLRPSIYSMRTRFGGDAESLPSDVGKERMENGEKCPCKECRSVAAGDRTDQESLRYGRGYGPFLPAVYAGAGAERVVEGGGGRVKDKEKAIRMLRDNIPIEDIVEATGYSRGYLYKLGSSNGIVLERVSINDYREQILYMIEQGKTPEEIGQAFGYSKFTVRNCVNAWKRAEKRLAEPEERNAEQEGIEEVAFPEKQLSFVERKTFRPPIVEYVGKKWQDMTELCCPR